jgi:tRNA (guanosine-2'-O-)-methyltransferase
VDPKELLLDRRAERIDRVVAERLGTLTLVLEGVHDPHNLAAVLRTAEGLGLQEVHVVEAPIGFRPSAAITRGADKWLDVVRHRCAQGGSSSSRASWQTRPFRSRGCRSSASWR